MTAVLNRLTLQLVLGTASAQLSSFLPCRPVLPFSSAETSSPTQRSPRPLRPSASGGADPQNKKGSDYDIPCCRRGVVSGPACRHCHRVSKVVFRRAGWHRTIPSEARFVTFPLFWCRSSPGSLVQSAGLPLQLADWVRAGFRSPVDRDARAKQPKCPFTGAYAIE